MNLNRNTCSAHRLQNAINHALEVTIEEDNSLDGEYIDAFIDFPKILIACVNGKLNFTLLIKTKEILNIIKKKVLLLVLQQLI